MFCLLPRQGYERVYMDIADINIDVPCAYSILEHFVDKSFSTGVIDKKLRDLCPCRSVCCDYTLLWLEILIIVQFTSKF